MLRLNEQTYTFTFETMLFLEENSIALDDMQQKQLSLINAVVAWNKKITTQESARLIDQFIEQGGNITELIKSVSETITQSAFFQNLGSSAKAQAQPD